MLTNVFSCFFGKKGFDDFCNTEPDQSSLNNLEKDLLDAGIKVLDRKSVDRYMNKISKSIWIKNAFGLNSIGFWTSVHILLSSISVLLYILGDINQYNSLILPIITWLISIPSLINAIKLEIKNKDWLEKLIILAMLKGVHTLPLILFVMIVLHTKYWSFVAMMLVPLCFYIWINGFMDVVKYEKCWSYVYSVYSGYNPRISAPYNIPDNVKEIITKIKNLYPNIEDGLDVAYDNKKPVECFLIVRNNNLDDININYTYIIWWKV